LRGADRAIRAWVNSGERSPTVATPGTALVGYAPAPVTLPPATEVPSQFIRGLSLFYACFDIFVTSIYINSISDINFKPFQGAVAEAQQHYARLRSEGRFRCFDDSKSTGPQQCIVL